MRLPPERKASECGIDWWKTLPFTERVDVIRPLISEVDGGYNMNMGQIQEHLRLPSIGIVDEIRKHILQESNPFPADDKKKGYKVRQITLPGPKFSATKSSGRGAHLPAPSDELRPEDIRAIASLYG